MMAQIARLSVTGGRFTRGNMRKVMEPPKPGDSVTRRQSREAVRKVLRDREQSKTRKNAQGKDITQ